MRTHHIMSINKTQQNENEKDLDWPFPERRYPKPNNPDYLGSKGLVLGLKKAIDLELKGKSGLNILDVGCGHKPFYPFLKKYSKTYIDAFAKAPKTHIFNLVTY